VPGAANIVWWALALEGSYLLFWLDYLCALAIGIGELVSMLGIVWGLLTTVPFGSTLSI